MSTTSIREEIVNYFDTQWANATPVAYENRPYAPNTRATWIRFLVNDVFTEPATLGSDLCMRTTGFVHVVINVPESSGTKMGRVLADKLIKIFVARQITTVTFNNYEKKELGVWDDFYQISMKFHFWGDTFVSQLRA